MEPGMSDREDRAAGRQTGARWYGGNSGFSRDAGGEARGVHDRSENDSALTTSVGSRPVPQAGGTFFAEFLLDLFEFLDFRPNPSEPFH